MIKEFAIDPCCFENVDRFLRIASDLGVENGRLLAKYPADWCSFARHHAKTLFDTRFIAGRRHMQFLKRIEEFCCVPTTRLYRKAEDWKVNALRENALRTFDGIVAIAAEGDPPMVLDARDLCAASPGWKVSRTTTARRDGELAERLRPLFRIGGNISFVDPHFDPEKDRWIESLRLLLAAAAKERGAKLRAEWHLAQKNWWEYEQKKQGFRDLYLRRLQPTLPSGARLRIVVWRVRAEQDGWHARYVLTEKGGVSVDWGLDLGIGMTDSQQKTDVRLLDTEFSRARYDEFQAEKPPPHLVCLDVIEVTGREA